MGWSIIIPTRNRCASLRATLAAIEQLEPASGFETIVVDDGGDVDLGFVERVPGVRLVRIAGAGPATARNTGARAARGECLAFTDDDCCPARDWLTRLADALERHPAALVGGLTINGLRHNAFSAASQSLNTFLYEQTDELAGGPLFFPSNNIALSRRGFEEIGGFDCSFRLAAGEDRAFCKAWCKAGRPLVYQRDSVVMHYHDLSALRFWRQHMRYGQGAYHLRKRGAEASPSLLSGRIRFTAALLAQPFRDRGIHGTAHPLTQSALLACSQVATACGYALAWFKERR